MFRFRNPDQESDHRIQIYNLDIYSTWRRIFQWFIWYRLQAVMTNSSPPMEIHVPVPESEYRVEYPIILSRIRLWNLYLQFTWRRIAYYDIFWYWIQVLVTNSSPAMTDLRKFMFRIRYPDYHQHVMEWSWDGGRPSNKFSFKSVYNLSSNPANRQTNTQTKVNT